MNTCPCVVCRSGITDSIRKFELFTGPFLENNGANYGALRRGEKAAMDHLLTLIEIPFGRIVGAALVVHISHTLRESASPEMQIADAMMELANGATE